MFHLNTIPQTLINHSLTVRQERRQLLKTFWLAVTVLFLGGLFAMQTSSIASIGCAILIAFAALLPMYLWCSNSALGMPIFPIFALTYLWTHALPLLSDNKKNITYSPEQNIFASVTVAGFLLLGTFTWFQFVKSSPAAPKSYRVLRGRESEGFFLIILTSGVLFNISSLGGWLFLEGGTFSLARSLILGLNVLSVFVLSYRCGTRELSASKSNIFWILIALYIITSAASLLLFNALSVVLLVAIAFVMGRQQVPWLPIILVLICISFLHYGKAEMRAKYWGGFQQHFVQTWEYPALYGEWIDYSFKYLSNKKGRKESEQKASFLERSSVIQMLLIAQTKTPKDVPYLGGKTYAIIPRLLIPRILNSNKIRSHEGTSLLSIHYGLQTRKATLSTTIGWGLLSEAYANFGLTGCAGLAIILGAVYGQMTRWSLNTPLLSSRSLFGVLMINCASQTEWTAGVFVSALFQSVVILVGITLVFMKFQKNEDILLIYDE